tara:strand:- start:146 stop:529 length:384 start_codon:yes stop_codon:yes gene_type:complete
MGNGLDTCIFHEGEDGDNEYCGLHDFHLFVDNNRKPRLSISWDDAANYESLFIDPIVSIGARNDDGGVGVIPIDNDDHDHDGYYDDDLDDHEMVGIIVGSIVGGVLLLAILGLLIYLIHEVKEHHHH